MALQITWAANALEDYEKIVDYLIKEWSLPVAEKFVESIEKRLHTLSSFPYIGISSIRQPSIRSISITKHNRLYYRISAKGIEVLNISIPGKIPKKIHSIEFRFATKSLSMIFYLQSRYSHRNGAIKRNISLIKIN